MPHFMIVLLYTNLLNLFWIKMSIFEGYGAFNFTETRVFSSNVTPLPLPSATFIYIKKRPKLVLSDLLALL